MFTLFAGDETLRSMLEPLFIFTSWQQSPVASYMLQYADLMALIVKVILPFLPPKNHLNNVVG